MVVSLIKFGRLCALSDVFYLHALFILCVWIDHATLVYTRNDFFAHSKALDTIDTYLLDIEVVSLTVYIF